VEYPWIIVSNNGGKPTAEGTHHFETGHRIPLADGRTDGIYASWDWDGQQLRVENDRYGIKPLYYCEYDGKLMVSPSILQLVAQGAPTDLDDAAMAVFLRLTFFLGEDTPFKAIRALPPNAKFQWQDGRLTVEGGLPAVTPQSVSYEQAMDGFIEGFRKSISRRPPVGPCAVPLSGGRDSRHIFYELCHAGTKPDFAVTMRRYKPIPGDDLATAQNVAKELAVEHVSIVPTRSFTAYETLKNIRSHMCTDEMWWVMPVVEYLIGRVDSVWDGLAGGVLSAGDFLDQGDHELYRAGKLEEVAQRQFREWSSSEIAVSGMLLPEYKNRFTFEMAMDRTLKELRRYEQWSSPMTVFYLQNRTRREIGMSPAALYDGVQNVYLPYLDHDLFDFLTSFQPEHIWNHTFHTDSILRGYPQWAHIPFEDRQGRWNMWFAPKQAILSTIDLYRYAGKYAPHWKPVMRQWWWNKFRGRESGDMPRRMIHYMMQLDAISSQPGAKEQLDLVPNGSK